MVLNKKTNHAVTCFNSKSFIVHSPLEKDMFIRVVVPELSGGRINCPAVQGSKFFFVIKKDIILEVDSEQLLAGRNSDTITI